jgi:homocysteine S-methyltransferase
MDADTAHPFPASGVVLTDGGLETWLLFQNGVDLPAFAAYPLVDDTEGRALLSTYYRGFVDIAVHHGYGLQLESPTWRANPEWALALGHSRNELARYIDRSVELIAAIKDGWTGRGPCILSGTLGPRGDGYRIDTTMTSAQAADYHSFQIGRLAAAGAEVVSAFTLGYADEAIGVAEAARAAGLPVVVSFTLETDGRLPSAMPLGEAIEAVDRATDGYPSHYMINCAHPTHFDGVAHTDARWTSRIGGLRANASRLSHAELDVMTELDDGDPADLAARYVALRESLPALRVVGGCCGTDHRHIAAIAAAWQSTPAG